MIEIETTTTAAILCVTCGSEIQRTGRRGRPPTRCEPCRDGEVREKLSLIVSDPETLFSGDPQLLLGTPKVVLRGREAQCTDCSRVFTSHFAFEFHKDFRRNPSCIEPGSLGMLPRDHRGIPVWVVPSDRVYPSRIN